MQTLTKAKPRQFKRFKKKNYKVTQVIHLPGNVYAPDNSTLISRTLNKSDDKIQDSYNKFVLYKNCHPREKKK